MDVVLWNVRHVEVHDVTQLLDVDAPRDDVRRYEHLELTALESLERQRTLRL